MVLCRTTCRQDWCREMTIWGAAGAGGKRTGGRGLTGEAGDTSVEGDWGATGAAGLGLGGDCGGTGAAGLGLGGDCGVTGAAGLGLGGDWGVTGAAGLGLGGDCGVTAAAGLGLGGDCGVTGTAGPGLGGDWAAGAAGLGLEGDTGVGVAPEGLRAQGDSPIIRSRRSTLFQRICSHAAGHSGSGPCSWMRKIGSLADGFQSAMITARPSTACPRDHKHTAGLHSPQHSARVHTVSQVSSTMPPVSPALAFHAHQNTWGMALWAPSFPMPVFCR